MLPQLRPTAERWQRITAYLVRLARAVEAPMWAEASPHAGWTNKDLLAHIATGYRQRIDHLERLIASGQLAERLDIDPVNERAVAERLHTPVEALIEEMVSNRGRVLELMGQLTAEHLAVEIVRSGPPPYRQPFELFIADMSHDIDHAAELKRTGRVILKL